MSAVEDLSKQLEATSICAPPTSVPFSPQSSSRWEKTHLGPIPRYLFRVYTPLSDGFTDDQWCISRDALFEKDFANAYPDVFQTEDPHTTAEDIAGHLWWSKSHRQDNLMSWTSSLLFALQYIFYRHSGCRNRSSMRDIRLCIVDTLYLGDKTFIRDMNLIDAFAPYDHSCELNRLRKMRLGGTLYYGPQGIAPVSLRKSFLTEASWTFNPSSGWHLRPEARNGLCQWLELAKPSKRDMSKALASNVSRPSSGLSLALAQRIVY